MLKLLFVFILAMVFVLLMMQNLEPVPVYLLTGRPFNVPLVVVVLLSFFIGCIATVLTVVRQAIRRGGRRKGNNLPVPRRGM